MTLFILLFVIALLAVFYLFLVMPRVGDRADMELLLTHYAHRGLWNEERPENSLSAFAAAVHGGYGIELDVHLSRDGRLMVFHDDTLKRMCGDDRRISDLTAVQLRSLSLGRTQEHIPTLAEVFSLVQGRVPILIEIKGSDKDVEICKRLAVLLDKYNGAVCVQSFNPIYLRWFRHHRPRFARGILVARNRGKGKNFREKLLFFLLSHVLTDLICRPDFFAVASDIRHRPVFWLCRKLFSTPVFVWTVRTPSLRDALRKEKKYMIFEKLAPNPRKRSR